MSFGRLILGKKKQISCRMTIINSLYILINTIHSERNIHDPAVMSRPIFEGIHYYIQSRGIDLLEDFRTNLDVSLPLRARCLMALTSSLMAL